MRIHLGHSLWELLIPFQSLKYIFRSECQPWMGCPEKVGTAQILVPVRVSGRRISRICSKIQKRNRQIRFGISYPSKDVFREFLIDRHPITPCVCQVKIIKELVKAGDLGRLQGLIRDQRSLQNSKYGSAHGRPEKWIPYNPKFRVELLCIVPWKIAAQVVVTGPNG